MEDNLKPDETFSPSIFEQARLIANNGGATATTGLFDSPTNSNIEIDLDTSKILVGVPFDVAAFITKSNEMLLTENETEKLGKLWRGPLQRLLSQYENSDIAIAAIATLGIVGEKYYVYKSELDTRNNSGNERERENKLHEVTTAKG